VAAGVGTAQQVIQGNPEEIGDPLQDPFAGETGTLLVVGHGRLGHTQLRGQVLLTKLLAGAQLTQARRKLRHEGRLTQFG
jgi:hypothetical protein